MQFLSFIQTWIEQRLGALRFGVIVVVLLIVGYALLWPQFVAIRLDQQELNSVESALQNRGIYLQRLQAMENNYNELDRTLLAILRDVLPEQELPTDIYPSVESAFADAQFTIQGINVTALDDGSSEATGPQRTQDVVSVYSVTVNAQAPDANYDDFKAVLSSLEQQRRVFNVESINYSSESSAFTFVLTTYAISK